ncbi:MAG: 2,3,4,5-tetrahydropyridine-2,6-dicarboxylate N-succinyltransferase, partial [Betaproteobacteria bacterium]|nr:2,3,4,5-tetrahydropyridine-2,6-dicarboxylate N-succinyltransferase [Betaproteobacteria bacterium]
MNQLQSLIEQAWENRADINTHNASHELRQAVQEVLQQLDEGTLRVAEKSAGQWQVHQWIKKAVLLSFRLEENQTMP